MADPTNLISFSLLLPRRILFGAGRIGEAPDVIASFGSRACLVTGKNSYRDSEWFKPLTDGIAAKGVDWVHFGLGAEPTVDEIDAATARAREFGVQAVLAAGGGSAIDAGKAIAALTANDGEAMDYLEAVGRGKVFERPALPCVACPTTSGTGAEATKNAVLRDAAGTFKRSMRDDSMMPVVAIVDPDLTKNCPLPTARACAMDALTQLLEAWTGRGANLIIDRLAHMGASAAAVAISDLFTPSGADAESREKMVLASFLGGVCLANAGLGVVHALASPLGAFFPIPHGVACAALLPAAIRCNLDRGSKDSAPWMRERYFMFAKVLACECGEPGEDSTVTRANSRLPELLSNLNRRGEIPGLASYGVRPSDFDRIVRDAGASNLRNNPVALTESDLHRILEESL